MSKNPPVHPSAEEVAEEGIEVVRDVATDANGVVVHPDSRTPIETEEKQRTDGHHELLRKASA